ncbi:hypothetical protein J5834_05905 [bacterium]|nr:hypothetical protein [bacterium]
MKKKVIFIVLLVVALLAVAGGIYLTKQEQNLDGAAKKIEEVTRKAPEQKKIDDKKIFIKKSGLMDKRALRKTFKLRQDNLPQKKDESPKTCSDN